MHIHTRMYVQVSLGAYEGVRVLYERNHMIQPGHTLGFEMALALYTPTMTYLSLVVFDTF